VPNRKKKVNEGYGPDLGQTTNGPRAMYIIAAAAINRELPPNQLKSIHLPPNRLHIQNFYKF
jgi:hypothetical protein